MSDLKKLKALTENLTILYVEDSAVLLKRMSVFLNNIFKTVHQAVNGKEGLECYQRYKPDIVITDLNMPIMSGHEMIKNLKEMDPDANIIIVSAYSDTENLLESIHLGVIDFVPKPVDSNLLQEVLMKVATKVSQKTKKNIEVVEKEVPKNNENLLKKLDIVNKSHVPIEFINHYKGVPIFDNGHIKSIDKDSITVEVPFFQSLAIKYEGKTVLDSELLDNAIEATLEKVNAYNGTLKLKELKNLSFATNKRKQLTVEPDKYFAAVTKFNDEVLDTKVVLLSGDFISLVIDADEVKFMEGDGLDLEFNFDKVVDDQVVKKIKITTKGEVYIIDQRNVKQKTIMILFELESHDKSLLEAYIEKRRLDLIVEFKQFQKH